MLNKRQFVLSSVAISALAVTGGVGRAFASERPFTFVSWGGALSNMEKVAFMDPYSKATGKEIANVSPTSYAKIKAMVEAGHVEWDLVTVGGQFAYNGSDDGLLEEIDYNRIPNASEIDPGYRGKYGMVTSTGATVIAWNTNSFPADAGPQSWADFWDVKRFPGPRGLYKRFYYNYEAACLAAGMTAEEIYPATDKTVEVAMGKLKELKPHVSVWWGSGAQPPQLLSSGEIVLSSAWDGRMSAIEKENAPTAYTLKDAIAWGNVVVVPKGTPYKDMAMDVINYSIGLEAQMRILELNTYGPVHPKAAEAASPERRKKLVTAEENSKDLLILNEQDAAKYIKAYKETWQEFQLS